MSVYDIHLDNIRDIGKHINKDLGKAKDTILNG
jgi:hypothetical protein